MKARAVVWAAVFALLLTSAGRLAPRPQADPKPAAAAGPEASRPPIVRTDLLFLDREEPGQAVRNIFRPKASSSPAARPAVRRPSGKAPAAAPPAQPAGFALELTYIGSVGVSGRIMALVLRGGQTVSVAEGDEVLPGYRVVRITAEEIVVEGPNSERKTFTR
jgi:hypothetical protein